MTERPRLTASEAAQRAGAAVAQGDGRFVALFADTDAAGDQLRYIVAAGGRLALISGVVEGPTPSLDRAAARWHEIAVSEQSGFQIAGLPQSPSPITPSDAEAYRSVGSPELSTVLYGPVRSGISEAVRWIIETAGEDFVAVHASFGFKNRGLERRFVGVPLESACLVAEEVSSATAASHASAFARAGEDACGIEAPVRAAAIRAILVEFERIHQHLDVLGKLADDASLSVGSAQTFAAKERVHRLLAEAVGNRFARGVITVGGARFDAFAGLSESCGRSLDALEREVCGVVDELFATPSWIDRLVATGRLSGEIVRAYGGVGPVARGSGVDNDARGLDGWLFTPQEGDAALATDGDALARARVRRAEIRSSFRLIRNALDAAPAGPHWVSFPTGGRGEGVARVESPQGELVYYVRFGAGIERVAIRSASFQNWPLFVPSLAGWIFTDFSFIEHSFGLIVAETDR